MEFFPEIDLNAIEAEAIARGLYSVALVALAGVVVSRPRELPVRTVRAHVSSAFATAAATPARLPSSVPATRPIPFITSSTARWRSAPRTSRAAN